MKVTRKKSRNYNKFVTREKSPEKNYFLKKCNSSGKKSVTVRASGTIRESL